MKRPVTVLIIVIPLFLIVLGALLYNGIIWFVYPENMGYTVKGIDVARYQGNIDWKIISSQKIKFAFIKATEGASYSDPMFQANIVSSRNAGIYSGAYHFFNNKSTGKMQAENFIKIVSEYQTDLPPVLDFEISNTVKNKETVIKEAKIFLYEVEKHFGVKPIIYTTHESYNAFLADDDDFSEYPLWFRDLFKKPSIKGNRGWLFWQYCNRGRLDGIDIGKKNLERYVDLNVFSGGTDEFELYVKNLSLSPE